MTIIKRIFDFYLDASIHVALAIFSLVQVTALSLGINVPKELYFLIFFGSIACYNFVKYGVEAEKYILLANRYHKNIQFFSFGCLLIAFYQLFFLSEKVILALLVLMAVTGLYALPVLPKHKNFRSLSGLKILIVALVWAGTTVVLPVFSQLDVLSWNAKVETFQRFMFVLVLLVPFEIRDLKYDSALLKTLPQRIGVKATKIIGVSWIALFYFSTFLKNDISQVILITNTSLALVLSYVIYVTKVNQKKYFASFWVEALPLFWYMLLFVLSKYFTLF
ncbi:UbiA prenyltransferase family protein [Maribacter hydrothermalis]|uniref:Prenyltransferase n=1 Tax=Maribacter hydrothermalis TaxID=1836467 RepID=A0A1B7ZFP9_9FLAO|nr:hypothetical protein [Maribacter hydrothermalis]APQ17899.1 hypothetical protein BTR34_11430 [Maribacter hydrothermalis]OBR42371.1 hypothetical protein A9200_03045 [Maribacter hydrothermalis]